MREQNNKKIEFMAFIKTLNSPDIWVSRLGKKVRVGMF